MELADSRRKSSPSPAAVAADSNVVGRDNWLLAVEVGGSWCCGSGGSDSTAGGKTAVAGTTVLAFESVFVSSRKTHKNF